MWEGERVGIDGSGVGGERVEIGRRRGVGRERVGIDRGGGGGGDWGRQQWGGRGREWGGRGRVGIGRRKSGWEIERVGIGVGWEGESGDRQEWKGRGSGDRQEWGRGKGGEWG